MMPRPLPKAYEPLDILFSSPAPHATAANLVVIGAERFGNDICVDRDTGRVWSLDPEGDLPTRFINSDVERLMASLGAHEALVRIRIERGAVPDEDAEVLSRALAAIDADALADEEHWWAVIVEQIGDGLM